VAEARELTEGQVRGRRQPRLAAEFQATQQLAGGWPALAWTRAGGM